MWEQNGWLGSKINAASGNGDVTMDGQFAGAGGIEGKNHRRHAMELPLRTEDLPRLAREASSDTISAFRSGAPPEENNLFVFSRGKSFVFFYLRLNMSMMAARMASLLLLLLLLLLLASPPPPPTIFRGGFPPASVRIPVVANSPPYFRLSSAPAALSLN